MYTEWLSTESMRMRIATHLMKTFQRNQSGYEYDAADFHLHHQKVHFGLFYRKSSFFPDFLIFSKCVQKAVLLHFSQNYACNSNFLALFLLLSPAKFYQ